MEVTTVFSRSFPETTAFQLNSWHLDDTVTHRGSYAFGERRIRQYRGSRSNRRKIYGKREDPETPINSDADFRQQK
jgi:hypothetical protein